MKDRLIKKINLFKRYVKSICEVLKKKLFYEEMLDTLCTSVVMHIALVAPIIYFEV